MDYCHPTCGRKAEFRCPACQETRCPVHSRPFAPDEGLPERQKRAYNEGASSASSNPMCSWCRDSAGRESVSRLAPPKPLPNSPGAMLVVLFERNAPYGPDEQRRAIEQIGGIAAVVRAIMPRLCTWVPADRVRRDSGTGLTGIVVDSSYSSHPGGDYLEGSSTEFILATDGQVWLSGSRTLREGGLIRRPLHEPALVSPREATLWHVHKLMERLRPDILDVLSKH
jgi:hypothetical protein